MARTAGGASSMENCAWQLCFFFCSSFLLYAFTSAAPCVRSAFPFFCILLPFLPLSLLFSPFFLWVSSYHPPVHPVTYAEFGFLFHPNHTHTHTQIHEQQQQKKTVRIAADNNNKKKTGRTFTRATPRCAQTRMGKNSTTGRRTRS